MANATFDLAELNGSNGFVINGVDEYDEVGKSVSGAGDVNGDGIADLIVGAPGANQSYVIFGNANGFGDSFELSTLDGSNGFAIDGIEFWDDFGFSVSTAGDINNDGIDDVIIGALQANQNYVVFGSAGGFNPSLDVTALDGSNGFAINGIELWDNLGFSVSTAGDINNDGIDDVIIGAPWENQSYVVFGNAGGFAASFDLSTLDGSNGFAIDGIDSGDDLGFSVSTAGDINNDGIDDVIIGALEANQSYVVFGNAGGFGASVDLSALDGSNGFAIDWFDWFGSVNGVGDVNGDGIDDLAIGGSPEGYVVFGRTDGFNANFDLSALDGDNGFAISGAGGFSTYLVSGAGDINGDGFADVLVGETSSGKVHAIFGGTGIGSSSQFIFSYHGFPDDYSTLNGSNGFVINGIDAFDSSGFPVSDAGDVNGDGLDDLIIGDPDANQSYVLYGNTAPELDLNGSSVAGKNFVANFTGTAVSIVDSANLILTDSNSSTLIGATITIANVLDGEDEALAVNTSGTNITASYDSATGMLTLTGEDAVANYRQVLQTITYDNTAAVPNTTHRIIEFEVDDGAAHSNTNKVATTTLAFGSGDPSLVVFYGINAYDGTGWSVSGAGDINGDGFDDLIIGAPGADSNGQENAGSTYVVFGSANGFSAGFELSTLDGSNGFVINGLDGAIEGDISSANYSWGDSLGASVSPAGDINGDGFDDIVVGAPGSDPNGVNDAGASYVVFGQADGFSATFDLSTLDGSNGFVINGIDKWDWSGDSVSSAGDVNGDGIDDLIIGAFRANPNGENVGSSYIVFGQVAGFGATLDLSTLDGSNGFAIHGIDDGLDLGDSVSSAGDVNGDGIDDLIIGAPSPSLIDATGSSYVVFGQSQGFGATLDLSTLDGSNGFAIESTNASDSLGDSVSAAGDINDDGFDDLIIGAPDADPNGTYSGSSYIVFGRANGFLPSFDLSTLDGSNGFAIDGANEYKSLGASVSAAGDVNGDGFDDLIIGAPIADANGQEDVGSSYVVFGKSGGFSATLDPSTLDGSSGFVINGLEELDVSGVSVSAAGDVNGDGVDDLIIGAPERNPNPNSNDRVNIGKGYLVFGNAAPELDLNGGAEGIDLTATFTDSPVPIVDAADLTLTDLNDTTLSGATVTITNLIDGAAEVLAADITGTNITANYDATTGTLNLNGEDTLTNYQQILETLTYDNTAETPDTADRIIEFVVDDGGYHSNTSAVATTTLAFDTASSGENLTLGQTIATQSNSLPAISAIANGLFSSEIPVEPIAGTDVTAIAGGLV